jgi:hypothetical protein
MAAALAGSVSEIARSASSARSRLLAELSATATMTSRSIMGNMSASSSTTPAVSSRGASSGGISPSHVLYGASLRSSG